MTLPTAKQFKVSPFYRPLIALERAAAEYPSAAEWEREKAKREADREREREREERERVREERERESERAALFDAAFAFAPQAPGAKQSS